MENIHERQCRPLKRCLVKAFIVHNERNFEKK
jgi:hypothetical protein